MTKQHGIETRASFVGVLFAVRVQATAADACGVAHPTASRWCCNVRGVVERKLREQYLCLSIDEYLTSQRCTRCGAQLHMVDKQRGMRLKQCSSCKVVVETEAGAEQRPYILHRDTVGALNMLYCFLSIVATGKRPAHLARDDDNDDGGGAASSG